MGVVVKTNKHHCRRCGLVFCDKCSSKRTKLPELGLEEEVRVCDACYAHVNKKSRVSAKVREMLVAGAIFRKHGRSGWPHPRTVRLSDGLGIVHWHKVDNQSRIENLPIVDVTAIKVGQETDVFRSVWMERRQGCTADYSSIITHPPNKMLHLKDAPAIPTRKTCASRS